MIGALKGKPEIFSNNSILIMVGGVGYKVFVSNRLIEKSLKTGGEIFVFIHTHVKEDALELYGFLLKEDLNLFELLISVSGIGPKTAILIMDKGEKDIREAIISSDVEFFTAIPRIGKKNAQKIIIELKSKIGSLVELDLSGKMEGKTKEVYDALSSMGFKRYEITDALNNLPKSLVTSEDKIKGVLKLLGSNK